MLETKFSKRAVLYLRLQRSRKYKIMRSYIAQLQLKLRSTIVYQH